MTDVSRETRDRLAHYKALVIEESQRQNLISASTIEDFDRRHLDDGVQVANLGKPGNWCDIGSGAGLPGIIIAIVTGDPITLVEPRKLRADFLRRVVAELALDAEVAGCKAQNLTGTFANITARAVADTSKLFAMAAHLSEYGTRWILPKGQSAKKELDAATQSWQGNFTLVPSRTSEAAMMIVAEGVRRRGKA